MLFYSGIDVVLNHRLTESGFGSKKDYTVYLKDYMKKIVTYLESNGRGDEVDTFKKNINGYMKDVLGRFKDLQFFVGESMDNDAMIMIMDYKDYQVIVKFSFAYFLYSYLLLYPGRGKTIPDRVQAWS